MNDKLIQVFSLGRDFVQTSWG